MNPYRNVTIEEARDIAQSHGLEQIVVWHLREGEGQHVTTWGEPLRHSLLAAEAGNAVKEAADWPDHACRALPHSLAVIFADLDARLSLGIVGGLDKGTVLAVLMVLRDCVRVTDPDLAEQLAPAMCEAAKGKGAEA